MSKLHVYNERTIRYLNYFNQYIVDVKVILDVGSGPGDFSKALVHKDRVVIALDIDKNVLINGFRGIYVKMVERVCADAHNIPFSDNSLDYILALSILEHLRNPEKCIIEFYRVLKYGGFIVIQLPNLQYLFEPHTKWPLLYFLPRKIQSRILEMTNYPYINMKVTIKYTISALLKAGLKIEKVIKIYHLNIMKILPFAPAYIIIARKV